MSGPDLEPPDDPLARQIAQRVARKRQARRQRHRSAWFGLGMYGMVGWSIAVPTVLGAVIGLWIDTRWPSPYSWTLMLMVAGLLMGCWNAWYWVSLEQREIQSDDIPEAEEGESHDD